MSSIKEEDVMPRLTNNHMRVLCFICAIAVPSAFALSPDQAMAAADKVKVLYHVDGKDPEVAKYALALINKHIDEFRFNIPL